MVASWPAVRFARTLLPIAEARQGDKDRGAAHPRRGSAAGDGLVIVGGFVGAKTWERHDQGGIVIGQVWTSRLVSITCVPSAGFGHRACLRFLEGFRRAVVGQAAEHVFGPGFGEHGF